MTDTAITVHARQVDPAVADRQRRELLNEAIVLEHVSGRAWRVCDSRCPAGADGRFLGFVEERDGMFDVMQITETFIWTSFDSMRSALNHIVATNPQTVAWQQLHESTTTA